jgi:hypothetical protein
LILCGQLLYGQALLIILFGDKLSTETFQLGIDFDISASDFTGIDNNGLLWGWGAGAFGEIRFANRWSLQPALMLKTPAGATDITEDGTGGIPDTIFETYTRTLRTSYITVPLPIKYSFGRVKIGLGPSIGYLVSGTERFEGTTPGGVNATFEQSAKDILNKWDAGVMAQLEFLFKPEQKMRSMRLSLKYYRGLLEVFSERPDDPVYNSIFKLTISIPVGG